MAAVESLWFPIAYSGIRLDAGQPFFSTYDGSVCDADNAPDYADTLDVAYLTAGDGRGMLTSPGALADSEVYDEHALDWGNITSFFRVTDLSAEEFEEINDFRLLDYYFNKGEIVDLPEPFAEGTHLFYPGQGELYEGIIVAFYGAFGATGLMRIISSDTDHLLFDLKVQPVEEDLDEEDSDEA